MGENVLSQTEIDLLLQDFQTPEKHDPRKTKIVSNNKFKRVVKYEHDIEQILKIVFKPWKRKCNEKCSCGNYLKVQYIFNGRNKRRFLYCNECKI